ncbi:histidine kinase [Luteipulveratus sp. YIM 133132]|uniref:sensor histidine kinase n=1 Tax=Luteipulveratus flavus TaxID=3031728 RepID=UPI0023AF05D0|nr:histidine kinase [Luteipulveratus sp. YIM 133132]MDE9364923.1 histidine kinase [Luteipulveratus sp. YIM 133132]
MFRAQAVEARLALGLCWVILLQPVLLTWIRVDWHGSPSVANVASSVLAIASLVLFIRGQLAACRGGAALWSTWLTWAAVVLGLLPVLWGSINGALFLAWAVVVLHLRPLRAALTLAATGLLFVVLAPRGPLATAPAAVLVEMALLTLVAVAATRLAVLLDDLHFTREVLARRRVDVERERIGRDLHDLMGRTLVAASLRNQTVLRILGDRDPVTTDRLEELHHLLSRGQQQLRALTSGVAIARLDDELQNARMLCDRVNITLDVQMTGTPPTQHEALAGLAVRENITNVLKHSRASRCAITIDADERETVVRVVNDEVIDPTASLVDAYADSRLTKALTAAGGSCHGRINDAGDFESVARIPSRVGEAAA